MEDAFSLTELFDTSVQNISAQVLNILKNKELDEKSVIKEYLITDANIKL